MSARRQHAAALALCALALASVAAVATGPAAAQTDGVSNTTGATNVTDDLTLNASFASPEWPSSDVTVPETHNPLRLTANRSNYTVMVRSERLDASSIAEVLDEELETDDPDVADFGETEGGVFRMRVLDRTATIPANFSTAVTGPYTFEFAAGNTTATATTEVVRCECVGAGFLDDGGDGATFSTAQSGVVTVPVGLKHTDEAELEITGDDLDITATVVDGNDDGRVTLSLNTHLIGRNAPFDGNARPYWTRRGLSVRAPEDSVESIRVPEVPGGDYPLDTEEYDLTIRDRDDTLATSTLTVTESSDPALEARTGPADALTNATSDSLRTAAADGTLATAGTVSNGSALVYEAGGASLFGPFRTAVQGHTGPDRFVQAFLDLATARNESAVPGDVVDFGIDGPADARIELLNTSRNGGLTVRPDRGNDTLYVGLRTDRLAVENGTAVGSGASFDASLAVHGDTASQSVQFDEESTTGDDESTTPAPPSPEPPATPEQGTTPSPTTGDTPSPETAAQPADDPGAESPDATTTADGPGFGVAGVVLAVLALCAFAVGRNRD
ncbi:hypothetical protein BV210_08635 [Halorientalis sp. IM1011]|uniref:DUF7827 domain-containing protein n=1 Tax=Halorientalis sp. IM1011 TaxID=1932360 RepID=UPI00097CCEAB|nr:hypothetical protein [Halorientalis sp. IM1011]AQL42772.1 hypothetical protein BV210_08635 [Halorientalis sp. IM1011]